MKYRIDRRTFLKAVSLSAAGLAFPMCTPGIAKSAGTDKKKPNFIIIFADDLGYGDLGCYGHPTIRTPNIDRMAEHGQKWTDFYVAASVCTPSRAGLLTGRLPIRSGMCTDKWRVLFPFSADGLPQSETTIARALKTQNYATACIGKWHLGHHPENLPTSHGFDSFYGLPYSNDMDYKTKKVWKVEGMAEAKPDWFNVPLMRNDKIIERPVDQYTLTKRYTAEALKFIKDNKDKPFFLYFAHTFPHVPLFASEDFEGKSRRGKYGDVVEELDWSVGQVLKTLQEQGLSENTLVVFTSDNGPWLTKDYLGGSAGLLRDGKGTTFEGGMREPGIFYWPGKIKPDVVNDMGSTLDLLPTILSLAGAELPKDKVLDGYDLSPVLFKKGPGPRNIMYYYRGRKLYAIRRGRYKLHFYTQPSFKGYRVVETRHDPPLLYDLYVDPSEKFELSKKLPDVVEELKKLAQKHLDELVPGEDHLIKRSKTRF